MWNYVYDRRADRLRVRLESLANQVTQLQHNQGLCYRVDANMYVQLPCECDRSTSSCTTAWCAQRAVQVLPRASYYGTYAKHTTRSEPPWSLSDTDKAYLPLPSVCYSHVPLVVRVNLIFVTPSSSRCLLAQRGTDVATRRTPSVFMMGGPSALVVNPPSEQH